MVLFGHGFVVAAVVHRPASVIAGGILTAPRRLHPERRVVKSLILRVRETVRVRETLSKASVARHHQCT